MNQQRRRPVVLSALVSFFFLFESILAGQSASGLKIVVLEGNGTRTTISQPASRPLSLRVVDANNRPISGATVMFTSPTSGAGGSFLNGSNSMIVFTNQQGIAIAQDYRANATSGEYQIQIRAAYMGETATLSIGQENVIPKKSPLKSLLIAAAAGGALGAVWAAKGGDSSSLPPPQTQTAAPPTIVLLGSSIRGAR